MMSEHGPRDTDGAAATTPGSDRPPKVAKTYRLSTRAVMAVDAAVAHRMLAGERMSREEAVERAILGQYGGLIQHND